MWHSLEVRFAADHPTAAGHFPGNPIIPGAVLLDEVLQAVASAGGGDWTAIRSAKFLQPVRPGEAVLIRWEPGSDGQARFECRLLDPERLALTGTVQLEAAAR
jgi:3-hydroxymyristoyl/3-hydroxydecanoyl-(acyl carrier protein) dehydratase